MNNIATRSQRFLASSIDAVPMFVCMMIVIIALCIGGASGDDSTTLIAFVVSLLVISPIAIAVIGINCYLVAKSGQTIGKKLCGIKMVRTDGSPLSVARWFFLRSAACSMLSSWTSGTFGLVDSLFIFRDDNKCLHDMIADTIVVKV